MGFPKVKWGQSVGADPRFIPKLNGVFRWGRSVGSFRGGWVLPSSISAGRPGAPAPRPMGPAVRAGQGSFFVVGRKKINEAATGALILMRNDEPSYL